MEIDIIGVAGIVFAAAALGRLIYERRMDVLYGPYIEGRKARPAPGMISARLFRLVDRLRWKLRGTIYLAAIAAC